jgi:hypothetical protein
MRTCGSGRGYPVGWYEWNAGGRTVGSCALTTEYAPDTNLTQELVSFSSGGP